MLVNYIPLYKLFRYLSKTRKRQLYFLFFLLIINGFLESFSIATIIPFISLIALPDQVNNIPIIDDIFYVFLVLLFFAIFVFISNLINQNNKVEKQNFNSIIESKEFKGLSKVQQHKIVYDAIGHHMGTTLHALMLTTKEL